MLSSPWLLTDPRRSSLATTLYPVHLNGVLLTLSLILQLKPIIPHTSMVRLRMVGRQAREITLQARKLVKLRKLIKDKSPACLDEGSWHFCSCVWPTFVLDAVILCWLHFTQTRSVACVCPRIDHEQDVLTDYLTACLARLALLVRFTFSIWQNYCRKRCGVCIGAQSLLFSVL